MVKCKTEPANVEKCYWLTVGNKQVLSQAVRANVAEQGYLLETESGDYLSSEELRAIADKLDQLSGGRDA